MKIGKIEGGPDLVAVLHQLPPGVRKIQRPRAIVVIDGVEGVYIFPVAELRALVSDPPCGRCTMLLRDLRQELLDAVRRTLALWQAQGAERGDESEARSAGAIEFADAVIDVIRGGGRG